MVSKEDWSAAMSSEVFREYLKVETQRQAQVVEAPSQIDKTEEMHQLMALESSINKNPEMLKVFAALKRKFLTDPEYTAKVDPLFVEGVLMLDLDTQE
jgi:hypothetical protein